MQTDESLMVEAAQGSRDAFTEIVRRYEGRLIAYFLQQSGHPDIAEDCAQEVFIRLYRFRERYGPEAQFSTFLFTIARNYWIDVARARKHQPRQATNEAEREAEENRLQQIPGTDPGPPDRAEDAEATARLRAALQQLPAAQREVLMLGVIQEIPYAEVSRVLGIPVGTVKSRVHAAVQAIRRILNPQAVLNQGMTGPTDPVPTTKGRPA